MTKPRYLMDSSVFLNGEPDLVAELLGPLLDAGEAATCAVVELVVLSRISDPVVRAEVAATRAAAFQWLETTDQDFRRALELQGLCAGDGQEPVRWTALVVAAVAERRGVEVLHSGDSFEVVAGVTGQAVRSAASSAEMQNAPRP